MWTNQAGRCAYTGKRMTLTIGRGYFWRNWSVSIDRLDPTGDYSLKNVVLCRYDINRRKSKKNFFSVEFLDVNVPAVVSLADFRVDVLSNSVSKPLQLLDRW